MCVWRSLGSSSIAACLVLVAACESGETEAGAPAPGRQEAAPARMRELAPEPVPAGLGDDALAEWLIARHRYAEASPVVGRVVAARREQEPGSLRLGEALLSFGMVRDALGEPEEALPPLAEAWDLLQANAASAEMMGACADALGLACHGANLFEDAERAYLAAIEFRGDTEPWVSESRAQLGRLYLTMARYEEAEALLTEALQSADDDASRATRLRHLGTYHHTMGSYAKACEFFGQALSAARRTWGEGSPQVAAILGDLGLAQLRSGAAQEAGRNLKRCHDALQALPGVPPRSLAASANNLAAYYLFEGELDQAAELLVGSQDAVAMNNLGSAFHLAGDDPAAAEAFEIARGLAAETLTDFHPLRVQILQNEACLKSDRGELKAALDEAREAGAAALGLLGHVLAFGAEQQKLDFRSTSDPLSLLCSFGAPPEEIAEMLLQTKGIVLDSVLGSDAETVDLQRAAIPDGATFIDYAIYQHYLGRGRWEQRYGAAVLHAGEVRWVQLGKAKRLRGLLAELGAHMDAQAGGGKSDAVFSIAGVLGGLYDFCLAPLGELSGELIISPDAELSVVPFAALRHQGRFFAELAPQVRFVPSARATDAGQSGSDTRTRARQRWALCAVERYAGPALPWPERGAGMGEELWARLSTLGDLPGVGVERRVLGEIADFQLLPTRESGLRGALLDPPRVLHFSCHGFFMGGSGRPMERSGLVLGGLRDSLRKVAGGEPPSPDADNILFAGEIAGLDLQGTQLVTLAACETGLGVRVAGEGVLGLQRGFQLAGARNILMTLWAVSDESLPEFLAACYRKIHAGEPAAAALWSVQSQWLPRLAGEGAESLARAVWLAGGVTVLGR